MTTAKSSPSREEIFRTLPIPTALRIMILPAVTSQLIVLIYNMADTFSWPTPRPAAWRRSFCGCGCWPPR